MHASDNMQSILCVQYVYIYMFFYLISVFGRGLAICAVSIVPIFAIQVIYKTPGSNLWKVSVSIHTNKCYCITYYVYKIIA